MKKEQEIFIKLISEAMGNTEKIDITDVDLGKIVDYALEQNLETMVLTSLKNKEIKLEDEIKNKLTKAAIYNNLRQITFINKLTEGLKIIKKEEIRVILMKGLIMRDYYKNPIYRSMGDGDILIDQKNIERVIEILQTLGFEEKSRGPVHIHMKDKDEFIIEIHTCLISHSMFPNEDKVNQYVWEKLDKYDFNGIDVYRFNNTNFLTHMMLHLAKHKKSKNISIRGLCDVAVFLENEKKNINWNKYNSNMKELNLEKFSNTIFIIVEKIFNINLENQITENLEITENQINQLMEEIFDSGVHGKKEGSNKYSHMIKSMGSKKFLVNREILSTKYEYARKYKILLPIAWLHRIIRGIFNKEFTFKEKIKYVLVKKKEVYKLDSINKWMGI